MPTTRLTQDSRRAALEAMSAQELDILVVGGGVTGAGIALDAATRGLRTGIVEAQDWGSGTSSRSSRLVHGGLRYLLMLDFKLVHEALRERDLLLSVTAPHLVRPVPFLYPLSHRIWERPYVATGLGMYDALAASTSSKQRALPIQKHLSFTQLKEVFPDFRDDAAVGAVRYFDAQVDDARLVLTLVRTAVAHGALAASRSQAVRIVTNQTGVVVGADIRDLTNGVEYPVRARQVIAATGVWTERTQALAPADGGLRVLASKGVHIVVPRDRIDGRAGIITMTEKSVLFIIPWDRYWLIGTTDTPWTQELTHPVATAADIDYVIDHANKVLARPLTRDDVISVYAGLRPLLQPGTAEGTNSAKVSREHTVASSAPGLISIAGGKLTTYRVMAADAVDFALGDERAEQLPSITARLPLLGAAHFQATWRRKEAIAQQYGWTTARVLHLLGRYGDLIAEVTGIIDADAAMGQPLGAAPAYLRAEIAYACTHEGAIGLEDIMISRTRLAHELGPVAVLAAADEVAEIAAGLLGWDDAARARQIEAFGQRVAAEQAAALTASDDDAARARAVAGDLMPMV